MSALPSRDPRPILLPRPASGTARWRPTALVVLLLVVTSGGLAVATPPPAAGRPVAGPATAPGGPNGYAPGPAGLPGVPASGVTAGSPGATGAFGSGAASGAGGPFGGGGPVVGAGPVGAPGGVGSARPAPAGAVVPAGTVPPLALSGPVPATGRGTFRYDDRAGATLGRSGGLRRYRVAVEDGSGEDVRAFSDQVQAALAGPGSWVDGGRLRLRRVPGNASADFTVQLATRGTAGRLCRAGGVDIRVGGVPYTSCRAPGKVIINLDRWRTSVPHFVRAGVPLSVYRTYVVNHEVGHQLGHRHEGCPGAGRPAPVMQQQSLFLRGCTANPWPYLDGRRYAGPAL
ncbi:DUF3152 domain-containing protein [Micromonospora humidisoli]|uniref:DUF3152 domain-containing protein n=1 Tax=Micromonospora sp. AKA109 TaxID=2733865 RepID=UPI0027E484E1|nr:DUF3152 domain-containing protein [Micromonospora sp. AKA109]